MTISTLFISFIITIRIYLYIFISTWIHSYRSNSSISIYIHSIYFLIIATDLLICILIWIIPHRYKPIIDNLIHSIYFLIIAINLLIPIIINIYHFTLTLTLTFILINLIVPLTYIYFTSLFFLLFHFLYYISIIDILTLLN